MYAPNTTKEHYSFHMNENGNYKSYRILFRMPYASSRMFCVAAVAIVSNVSYKR